MSFERIIEVDGEPVTFRLALSQPVAAGAWNPDESKIRAPSFTLSARASTRAVILQDPASRPRLSSYSDAELSELWRARWR